MSKQSEGVLMPKQLNVWSWEVISEEFEHKMSLAGKKAPKILDNKIVKNYLVHKCTGCSENPCMNYHEEQKPRRELIYFGNSRWNYTAKMCNRRGCKNLKCGFAHTNEERLYHPEFYQSIPCNYQLIEGVCSKFGLLCPYAHKIVVNEQIHSKFDLDTFKTSRCWIEASHDLRVCQYYHKAFDRRRSLKKYAYEGELCNNSNCEDGDLCNMCHNNFEVLYHKENFKKKPCRQKENCTLKEVCPYYHMRLNDRVFGNELELETVVEKCNRLGEKLKKLQDGNKEYEKFKCGSCFENNCSIVFRCGHGKCKDCGYNEFCYICKQTAESFVVISFIK